MNNGNKDSVLLATKASKIDGNAKVSLDIDGMHYRQRCVVKEHEERPESQREFGGFSESSWCIPRRRREVEADADVNAGPKDEADWRCRIKESVSK